MWWCFVWFFVVFFFNYYYFVGFFLFLFCHATPGSWYHQVCFPQDALRQQMGRDTWLECVHGREELAI